MPSRVPYPVSPIDFVRFCGNKFEFYRNRFCQTERTQQRKRKMTKEEIKKAIRKEFPGGNNFGLRKHLYSVVDDDGSIALACKNAGLGATCKPSIDRITDMQNELWG